MVNIILFFIHKFINYSNFAKYYEKVNIFSSKNGNILTPCIISYVTLIYLIHKFGLLEHSALSKLIKGQNIHAIASQDRTE